MLVYGDEGSERHRLLPALEQDQLPRRRADRPARRARVRRRRDRVRRLAGCARGLAPVTHGRVEEAEPAARGRARSGAPSRASPSARAPRRCRAPGPRRSGRTARRRRACSRRSGTTGCSPPSNRKTAASSCSPKPRASSSDATRCTVVTRSSKSSSRTIEPLVAEESVARARSRELELARRDVEQLLHLVLGPHELARRERLEDHRRDAGGLQAQLDLQRHRAVESAKSVSRSAFFSFAARRGRRASPPSAA